MLFSPISFWSPASTWKPFLCIEDSPCLCPFSSFFCGWRIAHISAVHLSTNDKLKMANSFIAGCSPSRLHLTLILVLYLTARPHILSFESAMLSSWMISGGSHHFSYFSGFTSGLALRSLFAKKSFGLNHFSFCSCIFHSHKPVKHYSFLNFYYNII